jgi:hypothetical protein
MIWITLLGFLLCFGFWACWIMLGGTDWILAGFGFMFGIGTWLDMLMEWIRRRYWKESQWRWIWNMYDTLGGTLVVPPYHHLSFSRAHIMSIAWIATCIYFVWSPEPAHIRLIVFGVFGWISIFTYTFDTRVSSGAHQGAHIEF